MRRVFCLLVFIAIGNASFAFGQAVSQSVIYSFCAVASCTDGSSPYAGLMQAADGNFYGTTNRGGASNAGSIFKIALNGAFTPLYSFSGANADGGYPMSGLVQGPDGNLYGLAADGTNASYGGTFFMITPGGTLTTIFDFCPASNNNVCPNGSGLLGGLTLGSDGNFYGTTYYGGANNDGTVFQITPAGALTTLYSFCSQSKCADGQYSQATLVQASDGNFYGTTYYGGLGQGTVFKISTTGEFSTVADLCASACATGEIPYAGVIQGSDGNLYGTTPLGGNESDCVGTSFSGCGAVFEVTLAGVASAVHDFAPTDGTTPEAALMQASDGNYYGAARAGGTASMGTVFKVTPTQGFAVTYDFCTQNAACPDGDQPVAPLLQGSDGNLYGTTLAGGADTEGVVYKIGFAPALAAPVQLSFSPTTVTSGSAAALTWSVLNAVALTTQQCYASIQNNPPTAGTWTGKQTGKLTSTTYSGSASITPTAAGVYTYALTCGGTQSGFATLTVTSNKFGTATALSASPNPVAEGQTATLTATVTHSSGTIALTGTVTFSLNGTALGSGAVNTSGKATLAAPTNGFPTGSYPIVATYSGDANYNSSASAAYTVTLNKAATSTTLTASPNPVTPPAKCTLTATVKRTASGAAGFATGSVTFSVGTTVIGTAPLNGSGVATLSAGTSGIATGSYPVEAKYSGDSSDIASTSSPVSVVVQ